MGKFWSEKDTELVRRWNGITTQREELEIWNKLYPRIYSIVSNLLNKHYTVQSNHVEIKDDCISTVMLTLKSCNLKPSDNYFFYTTKLCKNYLNNRLVMKNRQQEIIDNANRNTFDINDDFFDENYGRRFSTNEVELDVDNNLNLLIHQFNKAKESIIKNFKSEDTLKVKQYILILDLGIEFLNKNTGSDWVMNNLFEYILINANKKFKIGERMISSVFKNYLGVIYVPKFGVERNEPQIRNFKKYNIHWTDDDLCPIDNQRYHREYAKKACECIK